MTFLPTPIINLAHSLPAPFYLPQHNGCLSGTEKGNEAGACQFFFRFPRPIMQRLKGARDSVSVIMTGL